MLMYIFGRFYQVRRLVKILFKRPRSQRVADCPSLFTDLDIDHAVEALKHKGCYLGLKLPAHSVAEILEFASFSEAIANFDQRMRFVPAEKEFYEAKYQERIGVGTLVNPRNCSAIWQLENDPKLYELAASHLETEPFVSSRLWWSYPGSISRFLRFQLSQEVFHYDTIDYNALKFFFYITPVDETNGPHMCVLHSHRNKKLNHLVTMFIGRYENQILEYYRQRDIVTICGDAGYGFVEDPFCFHRATPVQSKPRLMLEISYKQSQF
jgi:hypothetical protein